MLAELADIHFVKGHVGILWQAAQKQLVEKVAVGTIGFWGSFLPLDLVEFDATWIEICLPLDIRFG